MLDCGHQPSPHGPHTTGTAHTQDGREVCWSCSDDMERTELKTTNRTIGYLDRDQRTVTTWPGGHLMNVTHTTQHRGCTPTGGYYSTVHLRAIDVHGQHWHGTSAGPSMCAHLRKSKHRKGR